MRSKVVKSLALALVLGGASVDLAQTSPSGGRKPPESSKSQGANAPRSGEKSKLEEMLAEALKNNPDIRVAAANLALAEAELNRTRLQVTQQVVKLYYAIDSQKKVVEYAERNVTRLQKLGAAVTVSLMDEAKQTLALAKAKLAELEAQMPGLLGKAQASAGTRTRGTRVRVWGRLDNVGELVIVEASKIDIPLAEKLRKALQTPVKVDYKDMTLDAILNDLAKKVAGASFRVVNVNEHKTSLRFEEALPLSAALQALSDEFTCCFYVREYGILASMPTYAPPGAMKVEEFLRSKPAEK
ncbi:MAG TPA: hypothetical protein VMG10_18455 [Gemmataceae bacterium]|nr:hypothetical protein [Gemmataceae bacterium]